MMAAIEGKGRRGEHSVRLDLELESVGEEGVVLSEQTGQSALRVLRATTPGWRDGDDQGETEAGVKIGGGEDLRAVFTMRALAGGMTNAVFRCSKPSGENRTVLLRSYGKGTEMFFSRESELKAFQLLAERGLGPDLLATFEDGRVEEFLKGRALHAEDMRKPEISALVARRLAELHTLDLNGVDRRAIIFSTLEDFHRKALDVCGTSHEGVDVSELGTIIARVRKCLQEGVSSKIVFCHNDLQSGNIMYNTIAPPSSQETDEDETDDAHRGDGHNLAPTGPIIPTGATPPPLALPVGQLSLIDYEYSGYNPRGFDLGNYFCEWMADYETDEPHVIDLEKYPSIEERREFCRAYLAATHGVPEAEVSQDETEGLILEADSYSLASHLIWTIWALLQSESEAAAPGFDYLKYAAERLRAYRHFERHFLPRT